MPTYQRASNAVAEQVRRLVEKYHEPLRDAGVTCSILMARASVDQNGDSAGVAVTAGGVAAEGKIKVTSLADRVDGAADVKIVLDGDRWHTWSEREQNAILDHLLTSLELATQTDSETLKEVVVRDDYDRPKLKVRRPDHQFAWFDACVRRHGRDSIEWKQFDSFVSGPATQLWLPYMRDDFDALLQRPAVPAGKSDALPPDAPEPAARRKKGSAGSSRGVSAKAMAGH